MAFGLFGLGGGLWGLFGRRLLELGLKLLLVLFKEPRHVDTERLEREPAKVMYKRVARDIDPVAGITGTETELAVLKNAVAEPLIETADVEHILPDQHTETGDGRDFEPFAVVLGCNATGVIVHAFLVVVERMRVGLYGGGVIGDRADDGRTGRVFRAVKEAVEPALGKEKVVVQHHHILPGGAVDALVERAGHTDVSRIGNHTQDGVAGRLGTGEGNRIFGAVVAVDDGFPVFEEMIEELRSAVVRTVVDENDLVQFGRVVEEAVDELLGDVDLIADRNNGRNRTSCSRFSAAAGLDDKMRRKVIDDLLLAESAQIDVRALEGNRLGRALMELRQLCRIVRTDRFDLEPALKEQHFDLFTGKRMQRSIGQ